MTVQTATLTGRYLDAIGRVVWFPSVEVQIPAEDTIIPAQKKATYLDANGEFSIELPRTDQGQPDGWVWIVTLYIKGAKPVTKRIHLTGDLDMADAVEVDPVDPVYNYVLAASVGTPGGPAGPLDEDGKVPEDQLTAGGGGGTGTVESVNGVEPDGAGNVQLTAVDIPAATTGHIHSGEYDAIGAASTALNGHLASGDPHEQYALESDLGAASAMEVGTGAGTVAAGDDSRLTNARTPTPHAASHASAGADPVTLTQAQITNLVSDLAAKLAADSSRLQQQGYYPPAGYGFVALSGDPMHYQVPGSFGNNTIVFCRVFVPANRSITGAYFACRETATWDAAATGNKVSVFDDNGANPVSSANDETMWQTGPWRGAALLSTIAPQTTDRYVYALGIVRGYSPGGVAFMNPSGANDANTFTAIGPAQNRRRCGYWGQSAMPSSFDPTTIGTASGYSVCCGLTGS